MPILNRPKIRLLYIFGQNLYKADRLWRLVIVNLRAEIHASLVFLSSTMLLSFSSSIVYAADKVLPGEEKVALYYLVTHLHPAIYVILFGVFILAVLNLSYQHRFTGLLRPDRLNTASVHNMFSTDIQTGTSVVRVPGVSASRLTPLDGINHAVPNFYAVRNFVPQPKANCVDNFQLVKKKAHNKATTKVDLMQTGCILSGNTPLVAGLMSRKIAGIPEVIPDLQLCMACLGYGGKLGKHGLENTRGGLIMAGKKKQPNTKQAKKPKLGAEAVNTAQFPVIVPESAISKDLSTRISQVEALIEAGESGEFKGRVPEIRKEHHCQWGKLLEEDTALRQQILTLKQKENALLAMIRDRVAENVLETADQATEQGFLKQPES